MKDINEILKKCFILYDCPSEKNDKRWLTDELRKNKIEVIEVATKKISSKLMRSGIKGKFEVVISIIIQSVYTLNKSQNEDVIICWSSLTGMIFNMISYFCGNHHRIIAMNWLSPAEKKSWRYFLEKAVFENRNAIITVNTKGISQQWCEYFGTGGDCANKFIFLPDVYSSSNFIVPMKKGHGKYCFSGGMNNRDWRKIINLAYELPKIKFICVALEKDWKSKIEKMPDNIEVYFNIESEKYYKIMKEAHIILLPLLEDRPSGLINILKSAEYGILCCTSDTTATRQYYGEYNKDLLISGSLNCWKEELEKIWNMDNKEYIEKVEQFQLYIKKKFSPESAVKRLLEFI